MGRRCGVYRYFSSAEALLLAAASDGLGAFLDDVAARLAAAGSGADVVVEGIAFTVEEIERRTEVALVLAPARGLGARELTSAASVEVGRSLLRNSGTDWEAVGYWSDEELDELVRHMLRILQSLVVDPGNPPLRGPALRRYLRRWMGPAVVAGGGDIDGPVH
jgi:AcrR family transcriptional regulator